MNDLPGYIPPIEMLEAVHVEQRAKERYGAVLTEDDIANMKRQIRDGRGFFVSRKNRGRHVKVWLVWWESAQRIVPVYSHDGKITSVLPTQAAAQLIEKIERNRSPVPSHPYSREPEAT